MFNRLIRQIHRWLGLTLGLVLAVMGVSGALMAFDDEIMAAISPGIVQVAPRSQPPLSADALTARFAAQVPGGEPLVLALDTTPGASARITYRPPATPEHPKPAADKTYLDPYTGRILGKAHGEVVFDQLLSLHRFLLLSGPSRAVGQVTTGVAAMALLFFALSGLYIRWPRRAVDWRVWLTPDLSKRGRPLLVSLHTVVGTWLMLIYLFSATTGLTFSLWRGPALALLGAGGPPAVPASAPGGPPIRHPLDTAWAVLVGRAAAPPTKVYINIPKAGEPVRIRYLTQRSPHFRAFDEIYVEPRTGAILQETRFAGLTAGQQWLTGMVAVHRGKVFGLAGQLTIMLAAAGLPLFLITGYLLEFDRRRKQAAGRARRRAS